MNNLQFTPHFVPNSPHNSSIEQPQTTIHVRATITVYTFFRQSRIREVATSTS